MSDKRMDEYWNWQMENIVERMQDDNAGVSVKNVKTFMNKIPSVFTGHYNQLSINHFQEYDQNLFRRWKDFSIWSLNSLKSEFEPYVNQ